MGLPQLSGWLRLAVALVFAYSCEPNKGSEPGAGWGTLMAIREIAHPVVLMRPDSMSAVRRWQRTDEGPSPEFVIVHEPGWATAVRRNRLALLGHIAALFGKLADFSKLSAS